MYWIKKFTSPFTVLGIKRDADVETEANVDLTELLGIAGVPTFLFIHQEGKILHHWLNCHL